MKGMTTSISDEEIQSLDVGDQVSISQICNCRYSFIFVKLFLYFFHTHRHGLFLPIFHIVHIYSLKSFNSIFSFFLFQLNGIRFAL